jgi:hypothetical protein
MFDDDDETDDGVNVLIDFTQKVSMVRMMGNAIAPARFTIKAEVLPSPDAREIDFDIAFAKIKFWFETVVSRTIVFCRSNTLALAMFTDSDGKPLVINHLMISPHEPTDEHLGAVFQSKMSALSGGTMNFGVVRVNSESQSGLVWSYVGDWKDDLPDMENWFNKKPYYFTVPWWARGDVSTIDMIGKGVTDFSQPPPWAFNLDFIEAAIRPHTPDTIEDGTTPSEPLENVVIRGAFHPKVIEGGSEE